MTADSPDSHAEDERPWWRSLWLKIEVIVLVLVVLFYVAEDLLGAAMWKKAQAEIAASGQSLDPEKYTPTPVPDEQNFAALPLFQIAPDHSGNPSLMAMERALSKVNPREKLPLFEEDAAKDKSKLPYLGNWRKGEKPDPPAIHQRLADLTAAETARPSLPANPSSTAMFGLLCPALADLRAANPGRPLCRFDEDYTTQPVWDRPLGTMVYEIKVAQILAYEERLALLDHQGQLALDDLKIGWKIDSGVRQEPVLVAGLVALGIEAIQIAVIPEGLAHGAWDDRQLAELDRDLGGFDDLTQAQFSFRSEAAVHALPLLGFIKHHRFAIYSAASGGVSSFSPSTAMDTIGEHMRDLAAFVALESIPNGWFDEYKADAARFHFLGSAQMVDPVAHRAYPEREKVASDIIEHLWLGRLFLGATTGGAKRFAYGQVQLDQARIACRLERYRLAHGSYPTALASLVPAYGTDLPRDVMSGEPYRYRVNPDGTYLLYSIGWDQKDDGGKEGLPPVDGPDWVWPNQPGGGKSK